MPSGGLERRPPPTMEVSGRHARTRAIIGVAVSPANRATHGRTDASRDVARVVSDVSVLCPRPGVAPGNSLSDCRSGRWSAPAAPPGTQLVVPLRAGSSSRPTYRRSWTPRQRRCICARLALRLAFSQRSHSARGASGGAQRAGCSSRWFGARAPLSKTPASYASTTAWTRSRRSSFWSMCVMCVLTVVSLM